MQRKQYPQPAIAKLSGQVVTWTKRLTDMKQKVADFESTRARVVTPKKYHVDVSPHAGTPAPISEAPGPSIQPAEPPLEVAQVWALHSCYMCGALNVCTCTHVAAAFQGEAVNVYDSDGEEMADEFDAFPKKDDSPDVAKLKKSYVINVSTCNDRLT